MSWEVKVVAHKNGKHHETFGPLHPVDWEEVAGWMSVFLDFLKSAPKHAEIHANTSKKSKVKSSLTGEVKYHGHVKRKLVSEAYGDPSDVYDRVVGALGALVWGSIQPEFKPTVQATAPASVPAPMTLVNGLLTCTAPAGGAEWGFFAAGPSLLNVSVDIYDGGGSQYAYFQKSQVQSVKFIGSPSGSDYFSFNKGWPDLPTDIDIVGDGGESWDGGIILSTMHQVTVHRDDDDFIIIRP